jgi:Uma2 family endonuclease
VSASRLAVAADLAALPERPTSEIIHGRIVAKPEFLPRDPLRASPTRSHGNVQLALGGWVRRRFDRVPAGRWPGRWWIESEVHVEYALHEVYCHDLVGFRRDRVPSRDSAWPVSERPDWVCEVLSPGHERHDLVDKLWTLHRAGVPHYWVIDREDLRLTIHRWQPNGYLQLSPIVDSSVVRAEPFDAVELRTAVMFGNDSDDE